MNRRICRLIDSRFYAVNRIFRPLADFLDGTAGAMTYDPRGIACAVTNAAGDIACRMADNSSRLPDFSA